MSKTLLPMATPVRGKFLLVRRWKMPNGKLCTGKWLSSGTGSTQWPNMLLTAADSASYNNTAGLS